MENVIELRARAKQQFLDWFRLRYPTEFAKATREVAGSGRQLSGIWDTVNNVFDKITDTISKAGTAYVTGRAALDLVKTNVKRAKQGLAPLDSMDDARALQGRRNRGGIFGNFPPMLVYAGIGLAAFLILRRR